MQTLEVIGNMMVYGLVLIDVPDDLQMSISIMLLAIVKHDT